MSSSICDVVEAADATRFLLTNPTFAELRGRVRGSALYGAFIGKVERQMETLRESGKKVLLTYIEIAGALRAFEEHRELLKNTESL